MSDYVCSQCGASCYYDGRCGDGPILTCGCDKKGPDGRYTPPVTDRDGTVYHPGSTARPVQVGRD